jgi:hypothetical protein
MNRRLRDRLVALFTGLALLAPVSAQAARTQKDQPVRSQKRVVKTTRTTTQRTAKKVVALKKLVPAKTTKLGLGKVSIKPVTVRARLTSDPHPHSMERGKLGKSLATRLPDAPKTKVGRFVSVLGKIAGAIIKAPKVDSPEGTLGTVPGGTAYQNGVSIDDVRQGHLADCFFVAGLASVAFTHPEILAKAIKEKADGTMSIRLYHKKPDGSFEADDIRLDKIVPINANGRPSFAHGATTTEMWPAWMQKAYAAEVSNQKGSSASFDVINKGGQPTDALEALTGKPARYVYVSPSQGESLFTTIKQAVATKKPITAGTPEKLPAGAPVHEWHTYSVLDTAEHDGQKWVKVRNPWGYSEPGDPNGGDGVFEITVADFAKSFTSLNIGG